MTREEFSKLPRDNLKIKQGTALPKVHCEPSFTIGSPFGNGCLFFLLRSAVLFVRASVMDSGQVLFSLARVLITTGSFYKNQPNIKKNLAQLACCSD